MNIEDIEQSAIEEINKVENVPALNELKGKLLGKKSKLSSVFSMMKDLPIEEKKKFGEKVNQVKVKITEYLQEKQKSKKNIYFLKQFSAKKACKIRGVCLKFLFLFLKGKNLKYIKKILYITNILGCTTFLFVINYRYKVTKSQLRGR